MLSISEKGVDGLIDLCRQKLGENPMLGALFVFTNRRRTALKILVCDGNGFYLILKRFTQGKLQWRPDGVQPCHELAARELAVLLWNGNPLKTSWAPLWRPGSPSTAAESDNSLASRRPDYQTPTTFVWYASVSQGAVEAVQWLDR
jgi:transposase